MTVYERLSLTNSLRPVQTVNNIEFHSLQLDKPIVDDIKRVSLMIYKPCT